MTTAPNKPADKHTVGDTEIFMSYARLIRLVSIFPEGLAGLTGAAADPAVHASMTEILMADEKLDIKDYPKFQTYELSMEDGEALVEWGLAHAFGFFARKVNATLEQATQAALTIKEVKAAAEATNEAMSS